MLTSSHGWRHACPKNGSGVACGHVEDKRCLLWSLRPVSCLTPRLVNTCWFVGCARGSLWELAVTVISCPFSLSYFCGNSSAALDGFDVCCLPAWCGCCAVPVPLFIFPPSSLNGFGQSFAFPTSLPWVAACGYGGIGTTWSCCHRFLLLQLSWCLLTQRSPFRLPFESIFLLQEDAEGMLKGDPSMSAVVDHAQGFRRIHRGQVFTV